MSPHQSHKGYGECIAPAGNWVLKFPPPLLETLLGLVVPTSLLPMCGDEGDVNVSRLSISGDREDLKHPMSPR